MQAHWSKLLSQPFVGTTVTALTCAALGLAWLVAPWTIPGQSGVLLIVLSAGLILALVLVQWFPIHVRHNAKLHMGSVVLYLMSVLLPVPLAGSAALIGMLTGELMLRSERGGYLSDVASQAGRWVVLVLCGSLVAHLPLHAVPFRALPLVAAALVLWLGDVLTSPVVYSPISGEPPWIVLVTVMRESALIEGAQYLVGILGAVAIQQEPWSLILLVLPTALVYSTAKRATELQDNTREILESMADTVDLRDPYTGGHSRRVTRFAHGILRELGMHGPEVDLIVAAARVHDIGKIGIPDYVLQKDGPLSDEEWVIMRRHPEAGADLLRRYPDFSWGVEFVRHHHERWDGDGYPHRLRDNAIPFGARVIAVADAFDAMTSDRPYRAGMSPQQAAHILREGRGMQWDGAIVDAFLRSVADRVEQSRPPRLQIVPSPSDSTGSTASA